MNSIKFKLTDWSGIRNPRFPSLRVNRFCLLFVNCMGDNDDGIAVLEVTLGSFTTKVMHVFEGIWEKTSSSSMIAWYSSIAIRSSEFSMPSLALPVNKKI